jgi:hypothetical protein
MEVLNKRVETIKIYLSVGLMIFGCIMVMCGFWVAPMGIIDNSVLIIFGEISAFVGSVFGINMVYSTKHKQLENEIQKRLSDVETKREVKIDETDRQN